MFVAFGRVVVDHVEHHLQAVGVQRVDHLAELGGHRGGVDVTRAGASGVARAGAEEAQRVVAPVVDGTARGQRRLVKRVEHRQQRQRGDAQRLEVRDGRRVRQARVGAAQRLRDLRVLHREALDVQLQQHQVGHRVARRRACRRRQRRGHPRLQRPGGVVAGVEAAGVVRVAGFVAVVLRPPDVGADDLARPRVQQQLVRVEAVALLGCIGTMRTQAVDQARPGAREEAVEDAVVRAVQGQPLQFGVAIGAEQAEFDARGVFAEDDDVHAAVARHGTEGLVAAFVQGIGEHFWHRHHAGARNRVASGGSVRASDCARPCACTGCTSTTPPLPRLLPP